MRTALRWLSASILGFTLLGCAGTPAAPAPEVREALAPTGKLRVGLQLGSPHNVIRDPVSGEMRGVGFDLGNDLARHLGVPFQAVLYPSVGALLEGGKAGAWDVAFIGFSPARQQEWDFTPLHLQMEFGYLVPGGSAISTMADVDRPGVRVAVQEKSQPDVFLSRTLTTATVVRAPSLADTLDAVRSGRADAIFSIKPSLFEASNQLPGSRVLEGRAGVDPHAMALPKGRGPAAIAYARTFIDDAKSGGLVAAAIERAGIRGAVVAPADVAELKVLSVGALRSSASVLVPEFERQTGQKVVMESGAAGAMAKRVEDGEPVDVVIATSSLVERLAASGKVVGGTQVIVARVGMGMSARKDSGPFDISSVDALKRTLLHAKSIGFTEPASGASSAIYASKLLAGLDVAGELTPKMRTFPSNQSLHEAIAHGDVELGFGQKTEIVSDPRLQLVGALPGRLQYISQYSAAVMTGSGHADGAKRFVDFMASPAAAAVMTANGFE